MLIESKALKELMDRLKLTASKDTPLDRGFRLGVQSCLDAVRLMEDFGK